jgi:hypothetical protein
MNLAEQKWNGGQNKRGRKKIGIALLIVSKKIKSFDEA